MTRKCRTHTGEDNDSAVRAVNQQAFQVRDQVRQLGAVLLS